MNNTSPAVQPDPTDDRFTPHQWMAVTAILLVAAVTFIAGQSRIGPMGEHECLVAETAREMRRSGDWIVPHFGQMPRIRKTPLAYWTVALTSLLTGDVDEFTARMPSALAAVGTLAVLIWIARRQFGPRIGVVTGFVALTAAALPIYAHSATVEMQLTFWCALSYALFFEAVRTRGTPTGRWWAYAFYACFAIAMLAKFPMAGIVVGTPIGVYSAAMLVTRRWTIRDLLSLRVIDGTLLFLLICAPWPVLVWQRVPEATWQWQSEFLDRFSGELRNTKPRGWYYYVPLVVAFVAPWCLSIPYAVIAPLREVDRRRREALWLVWCWLVISLAIISAAAFKRAHYVLPSIPAALLLLGVAVDGFFFVRAPPSRRQCLVVLALLLIAGVAGGLYGLSVLRHVAPAFVSTATAAGVASLLFVIGAALAYAGRRPALSLLQVGAIAVIGLATIGVSRSLVPDEREEFRQFAAMLDKIVPPTDEVRWVARHPAPAVFYGGGRLVAPRLDDPTQLLKQTGGDFPREVEWLHLIGTTILERLRDPRPIWLIMQADHFAMLDSLVHVPAYIAGESSSPEHEHLILLTNRPIGRPAEARTAPASKRSSTIGHRPTEAASAATGA